MWLGLAIGLDESEAWLTGMLIHLGEVIIYRFTRKRRNLCAEKVRTPNPDGS
jgi:hypothetical protein